MQVLIPYTPVDPKSRLAPVLSRDERQSFARAMLEDVVRAVEAAGHEPNILSDSPLSDPPANEMVDERSLSDAVNAMLEPPMAVVMADLPLITRDVVDSAFDHQGDIVIGPGRGGGTNLLVVRDDRFAVDYHGASLRDHRRIAADSGLTVREFDSHRVSTDIDEPADLVEVLFHGTGKAERWLRERGFGIRATGGRVDIHRD